MEAKRAERRLSGKTVPAATRAAQSVCVCIEPPSLGIKACCQRLLSYYLLSAICLVGRSHQLTEVMGNGQVLGTERFKDALEAALWRRVRLGKPGRPRKSRQEQALLASVASSSRRV